jgi:hypothetical protein
VSDSFYAGAYWAARQESIEESTERLFAFMSDLEQIHPIFSTWFEKGRSRKNALRVPLEMTRPALRERLLSGRSRTDFAPRQVIEELGFSFSPWNGQKAEVGLHVHCGAYGKWVSNAAVIRLPSAEDIDNTLDTDFPVRLVKALVENWDPAWATLTSDGLREFLGTPVKAISVGFATYVRSDGRVGPLFLPSGVQRRALHHGQLLTIGNDPFNVDGTAAAKLATHLNRN